MVIIFILGLIVGSFLNCVIYRLETGGNFLKGRSFCPHCKHVLEWQDLIPVFSFLFLLGKCRYCRKGISIQYPLVELSTGIVFLLCSAFYAPYFMYIISCFLIVIFVYDLKHYLIPDKVVFPAILITLVFNYQFILTALGAGLLFLLIVLATRGKGMGIGDIKLAFLMGLILGWPNIMVALFSAFFVGAIIGIILIVSGKKGLKSEVPFGPFLVFGTFLAMFWGQSIMTWYLNIFC